MYHTNLQAMPGQLLFGRDMILNVQHLIDWTVIKTRKQQVGDLVILENLWANKYEQPYSRPYHMQQVNMNGTVHLKMKIVTDTANIHRIHPFKTPTAIVGASAVCARLKDRWC